MCEQEQLASDLDRALSLSQLGSLGASRKLTSSGKSEKSKGRSSESRLKERGVQSSVKAGKLKPAAKAAETARKVKGQKKTMFSPMRSELSSCSNSEYSENSADVADSHVFYLCCLTVTFSPITATNSGRSYCVCVT